MKRLLLISLFVMGLGGLPHPLRADDFKVMTAAEIGEKIVGNTITGLGRRGDCTFYDYFAKDGSATSKCGNYADTGQWRPGGDSLCIKWTRRSNEYCLTFQTDGSKYQVINPDRGPTPFPFSILPGKQER